jgi:hypothetical protein
MADMRGEFDFLKVCFLLHPCSLFTEENNEIYSIILCTQCSVLSGWELIHACLHLSSLIPYVCSTDETAQESLNGFSLNLIL